MNSIDDTYTVIRNAMSRRENMARKTKPTVRANGIWQGMNWIRQEKRLAIYLRDGLACAYCGSAVEQGTPLTLDHVRCFSKGGSNAESNLVTACVRCNSSRGNRPLRRFARAVASYVNHGVTMADILKHVAACTARPLLEYRAEADKLIARRGSAAKVLASLVNTQTVKSRHVKTGKQK
jgi:HNH endonuclease